MDEHALMTRLLKITDEIWGDWYTENDEEAYAPFSHREKVVSMIFYLNTEVENGGFHQWISNPTGMYVLETRDALLEIGATEIAELVDRAMRLFPDGCPARQWVDRQRQLDSLSEEANQQLYELGQPYETMCSEMLARVLEYWDKTSASAGRM